jgi:glycosyltransferase involved in cell wall biosynthesis
MNKELKKIAFISDHASPLAILGGKDTGGQNVYVAQLALHLAKQNYRVDIFTRREDEKSETVVHWKPGIRVIHIDAGPAMVIDKEELLPYMLQFEQNMLAFIQQERIKYELIHAHFFMSAQVAMGIKKSLHIPFVVTFHALGHVRRIHQGDNDRFPVQRLQIEAEAVAQADQIIAECPQDRDDLIKYYYAESERIRIVPCGYSPDEFYPVNQQVARKVLGLPPNGLMLLQLGRMVRRKGIDNVLYALALLKVKGIVAKLLIVGGKSELLESSDCPEYRRLYHLSNQLGISEQVIFTGRKSRAHLKLYYAAADIFVTTPWYEPFGITPLEAMACGTPVIGANVGGIKYSVADGQTGVLVPPKDPFALANAIQQMVKNPGLLLQFGVNSIDRVHAHFTWEIITQKIMLAYKSAITNNNNARSKNEVEAA